MFALHILCAEIYVKFAKKIKKNYTFILVNMGNSIINFSSSAGGQSFQVYMDFLESIKNKKIHKIKKVVERNTQQTIQQNSTCINA